MVVTMEYRIEVFDSYGRRTAVFDEVPLLDVVRGAPGQPDVIRGLLPEAISSLGPGCRVRATLGGQVFCEAVVESVSPQWSDTRKLILDQYVPFHEVVAFDARSDPEAFNRYVNRRYVNREVGFIVRDLIHHALGPVHFLVDHAGYPDGAEREYAKFLARKTAANELAPGNVLAGQWVGAPRLDASGAYAKDGDTVAGLMVDGTLWPDVRLMMIDTEETSRNTHAIKRHPEVAGWTDAQYEASAYRRKAEAAQAFLQELIDTRGIDFIELNPHRDAQGGFDDRVDAYGRYVGLAYGGGRCFNAALVEQGHADVYLYQDGRYLPPDLELKDYFSYTGGKCASIENTGVVVEEFNAAGGLLELLTALGYLAGGYVFSMDADGALRFRRAENLDRLVSFDPHRMGVQLGSNGRGVCNLLTLGGSPLSSLTPKTYVRSESADEYGLDARQLDYFAISTPADRDRLAEGLLEDLAYPEPTGAITFYPGEISWEPGALAEVRGAPLRRFERELDGEWGGRFSGRMIGRVREVRHRLSGKHVTTTVRLGSPMRSVENPLAFIIASQLTAAALSAFRLDDETVGLDMGYHLN